MGLCSSAALLVKGRSWGLIEKRTLVVRAAVKGLTLGAACRRLGSWGRALIDPCKSHRVLAAIIPSAIHVPSSTSCCRYRAAWGTRYVRGRESLRRRKSRNSKSLSEILWSGVAMKRLIRRSILRGDPERVKTVLPSMSWGRPVPY